MKKLLLVVSFSLSLMGIAETAPSAHTPSTDVSAAASTPVRATVATPDKAAKLEQFINACLVKRPSEEEIRKLLN